MVITDTTLPIHALVAAFLDSLSFLKRLRCPPSFRVIDDLKCVNSLLPLAPPTRPSLVARTLTPLQEAARDGRARDLKKFLEGQVDCLMELTPLSETPLHLAVQNGHLEASKVLLEHAKRRNYCRPFINTRNSGGNTVLHLATARKDLQVLKLILEDSTYAGMIEVNATNNGGFTALDILDVLPDAGETDNEIKNVLLKAGATRRKESAELKVGNRTKEEVLIDVDQQHPHKPIPPKAYRSRPFIDSCHMALLLATIFATITFHAALRIESLSVRMLSQESSENTIQEQRQDTVMIKHAFVLFNSVTFFSSVGLITILLHDLPLNPWLLIMVISSSGAYICAIMATSADDVVRVALLGTSILIAALLNCMDLDKVVLKSIQWMRKSSQNIATSELQKRPRCTSASKCLHSLFAM